MRICYIGHASHQRTGSTRFLVDILRELGEVEEIALDPGAPYPINDDVVRRLFATRYDITVFLQTEAIAERLPVDLGRRFIVPMWDSARQQRADYWQRFSGVRFLSFSRALHDVLRAAGCISDYFQFFPEPAPLREETNAEEPAGFFWERRPHDMPNLPLVQLQCQQLGITQLHVRAVPDIPDGAPLRVAGETDGLRIEVSGWHESRTAAAAAASAPAYYFAPRATEGIGMATLEAMASGQIVVAPDLPTANEYIAHCVTGLLYDPEAPLDPLSLPRLNAEERRRLAGAAQRRIARGRTQWVSDTKRLKSILRDDGQCWSASDFAPIIIPDSLHENMRGRQAGAD